MARFFQGQIVLVTIPDSTGSNVKTRPAVIITPTESIYTSGEVVVVAITSDVGRARSAKTVELPWRKDGHPITKLTKRCEVVCDWFYTRKLTELKDIGGSVPPEIMIEILQKCN